MKSKNNIGIYIGLIAIWITLLVVQDYLRTHFTSAGILISAVNGLVGLPLIVLVMVFLVGMYTHSREQKARKRQLMYIKSCMFRLEMKSLFISNFLALKSPTISLSRIKDATLNELIQLRKDAENIEYQSLEKMELVLMKYVDSQPVWRNFMNIAQEYGFEDIFQDMLNILHIISDVKIFKESHPERLFIYEAARNNRLMQKVSKVLGDGIRKYLDYAIELKEKQPDLLDQVIADYELSAYPH